MSPSSFTTTDRPRPAGAADPLCVHRQRTSGSHLRNSERDSPPVACNFPFTHVEALRSLRTALDQPSYNNSPFHSGP